MMPVWVKPLAAALALCGAFGAGWWVNGVRHERDALQESAGAREALDKALADERARADRYSQQVIDILAATPAVTNTVREVVRANPSQCVRPEPVTDSLRSAAARASAALAAARGDGAVPRPAAEAKPAE
jgi:hypothetical protein